MERCLAGWIGVVALLPACAAPARLEPEPSHMRAKKPMVETYEDTVNAWHRTRIERLRDENGWLSLVGLHWLAPGENSIGRDARHDVANPQLPVDDAGVLRLADGHVSFAPVAGVVVGGLPQDGRLQDDTDGPPTIVAIGTCRFHVIKRGDRFGIRMKDAAAPLRTTFEGIERFPVDPAWRVEARFEPARAETLSVASIIGTVSEEEVAGRAHFDYAGASCRMVLMPGSAPDRFFVVFADGTSGDTTYGGGRFVEGVLAADGEHVVLDFNRAYNPPCAFTPYATCPVPVAENRLPFAVAAGERKWGEHRAH